MNRREFVKKTPLFGVAVYEMTKYLLIAQTTKLMSNIAMQKVSGLEARMTPPQKKDKRSKIEKSYDSLMDYLDDRPNEMMHKTFIEYLTPYADKLNDFNKSDKNTLTKEFSVIKVTFENYDMFNSMMQSTEKQKVRDSLNKKKQAIGFVLDKYSNQ